MAEAARDAQYCVTDRTKMDLGAEMFSFSILDAVDEGFVVRVQIGRTTVTVAGSFRDRMMAMMEELLAEYEQRAVERDLREHNHT